MHVQSGPVAAFRFDSKQALAIIGAALSSVARKLIQMAANPTLVIALRIRPPHACMQNLFCLRSSIFLFYA